MKNYKKILSVVLVAVLIVSLSGCKSMAPTRDVAPLQDNQSKSIVAENSNSGGAYTENALGNPVGTERKLIVTSTIDLQTKEFDDTITKINNACVEAGGYIESSNVQGKRLGEDKPRSAVYAFRVPVSKLNSFKAAIKNSGNVTIDNVSSNDVTNQYFDTEGRLTTAKAHRESLLKLADKTANLSDLIQLQKEIAVVETEIESLTTTIKKIDSLTELSKVSVNVNEVDTITIKEITPKSFWGKIGDSFNSSIDFIIASVQIILIALTWLSPFILIAGIILTIIFMKKRKKKSKDIVQNKE